MALSIITQPEDLQPIHTPLMVVIGSNNTAYIDFKYKVTLTIFGTPNYTRTLFISPRPKDSYMELDLATHLMDFLNYDLSPFATVPVAPNVQYSVHIQENWQGVDRPTTLTLATKTATNVELNRQEWIQALNLGNFDKYRVKNGGLIVGAEPIILINKTINTPMYKDETYNIHVVGRANVNYMRLMIRQHNSAGNPIGAPYYITIGSTTFDLNSRYMNVDLSQIAYLNDTRKISFTIIDGNDIRMTEQKMFTILDAPCSPWERWKLVYLDKYGSFNNFSFNMISSSTFKIDPKTYRRRNDPSTDIMSNRDVTRYHQTAEKKYLLNTNFLNEDECENLSDLLSSLRVFREVRNVNGWDRADYLPIEILTKEIKPYAPGVNDMPQYGIEVRYAYEENVRR